MEIQDLTVYLENKFLQGESVNDIEDIDLDGYMKCMTMYNMVERIIGESLFYKIFL